jgi:DNA-binding CsgD family transcriptional regulator
MASLPEGLPPGFDPFHTVANHLKLLSKREREVYELLYSPMNQREMAKSLFISHKTVKYHLTNIYIKCKVNGRAQLLGKILENGNKANG